MRKYILMRKYYFILFIKKLYVKIYLKNNKYLIKIFNLIYYLRPVCLFIIKLPTIEYILIFISTNQ
jgi:hypothetical protein